MEQKINEQGGIMTDISPVMKIKKAIHAMKADIGNLDIRIGVVGNTLLHLKMKSAQKFEKGKHADLEMGTMEAF